MTKKQIEEALKHDYWWDAETCIAKGLCDEII
jgi:ATP-dependent protease ClpP protease subunit